MTGSRPRWGTPGTPPRDPAALTFTGGGDPTMHPALPEFARIARQHGLAWGLYSNGYALTPALTEQLLAHRPCFIRISVNSGSAAEHRRIYGLGEDGYRRVQAHLIALIRRTPPDTTVGIGYVFSRLDTAQARGIAHFVQEIGKASPHQRHPQRRVLPAERGQRQSADERPAL